MVDMVYQLLRPTRQDSLASLGLSVFLSVALSGGEAMRREGQRVLPWECPRSPAGDLAGVIRGLDPVYLRVGRFSGLGAGRRELRVLAEEDAVPAGLGETASMLGVAAACLPCRGWI